MAIKRILRFRWLLIFFHSTLSLHALDRSVSPLGSDSSSGTELSPWRTIQKAANSAQPGDVVTIRAGTYYEAVTFQVSGTESQTILFRAAPGQRVILDGSRLKLKKREAKALIAIPGKSHLTIEGLELHSLRSSEKEAVPMGIFISGSGTGITLRNNLIHHIEQNGKGKSGVNAHGIAVYGDSLLPLTQVTLQGNEVRDCILGASEAVVVNGNVNGFDIDSNIVHDCNNIGIDAIGSEGTCPDPLQDRARNGWIRRNTVYNIDTFYNPAYGGKPKKGGGERSAAGIYVDGGKDLIVERNHVFNCNFGVELASESPQGSTEDIVLRDNLIQNNLSAGLIMGGYDHLRGRTRRIEVLNNTFYNNDRLRTWAGQITLQYYVSDLKVENNIFWAEPGNKQILVHEPYGKKASIAQKEIGSNVSFDYNRFYCASGAAENLSFRLFKGGQQRSFNGLASWQSSPYGLTGDAHSSYGNPGFETPVPSLPAARPVAESLPALASAFALSGASGCIDAGNPAYEPGEEVLDFFGDIRRTGEGIDIGADERE